MVREGLVNTEHAQTELLTFHHVTIRIFQQAF